jgi:hypothetical protein
MTVAGGLLGVVVGALMTGGITFALQLGWERREIRARSERSVAER